MPSLKALGENPSLPFLMVPCVLGLVAASRQFLPSPSHGLLPRVSLCLLLDIERDTRHWT